MEELVVKAYITDLCGDEDPLDIDKAILQCLLQDAIFEKLIGMKTKEVHCADVLDAISGVIYSIPYVAFTYELRDGKWLPKW